MGHDSGVKSILITEDARFLISSCGDYSIRIWDAERVEFIHSLKGHTGTINSLKLHPNDYYVFSCSEDRSIKLWDLVKRECVRTYPNAHDSEITAIAIDNQGGILVSACSVIKFWNTSNKNLIKEYTNAHHGPVRTI